MSTVSLQSTIANGFVLCAEIDKKRQDYKASGSRNPTALERLQSQCNALRASLFHQRSLIAQGSEEERLLPQYDLLMHQTETQSKKLTKLFSRILSATKEPVESKEKPSKGVKTATTSLTEALEAFQQGHAARALQLMGDLKLHHPEITNQIFGKIYELAGKPKHAARNFGETTFFDTTCRMVSNAQKQKAVEAILKKTAAQQKPCPFCYDQTYRKMGVYSDGLWNVLQCLTPSTKGHLLVVPVRHIVRYDEMNEQEAIALAKITKLCANVFKEAYSLPQNAYLFIQKNGSNAGQSVFHLQCHLIPVPPESLWKVLDKTFGERDRLNDEQMQQEVQMLRPYFISSDEK